MAVFRKTVSSFKSSMEFKPDIILVDGHWKHICGDRVCLCPTAAIFLGIRVSDR